MVFIPAGDFSMGFTADELASLRRRHPDWPPARLAAQSMAHPVHLQGFWIYRYEVTVAQYRQFCWQTGRPEPPGAHDLPITGIRWPDAEAYCRWAGGYLPNEAEWEYAARGHDGRRYPWGNDTDLPARLQGSAPFPAGSQALDVSPFGVHDLSGNVTEWCADVFDQQAGRHACRGGSFRSHDADAFAAALRDSRADDDRQDDLGFRCVLP